MLLESHLRSNCAYIGITAICFFFLGMTASAASNDNLNGSDNVEGMDTEVSYPAVRQGGETAEDAFLISNIPYSDSGTTTGYTDDYEWPCPFGAWAPDVVYCLVPDYDMELTVDLFGSNYDTKVFVCDDQMNIIDCNDDYYYDNTSRINAVSVPGGVECFIVVDGYSAQHGEYEIVVEQYQPCVVDCLAGSFLEGEPPLVEGYVDEFNGGCTVYDQLGYAPIQTLNVARFCGISGWYESGGELTRDIDWFVATIPSEGVINIQITAELWINIWQISHDGCSNVVLDQNEAYLPCLNGTFTVVGEPGDTVEIGLGPHEMAPPVHHPENEFRYVLTTNLEPVVSTESRSWGSVKSLYLGNDGIE